MTPIRCEIYSCTIAPEACASRYSNSQRVGAAPVGNAKMGKGDIHCFVCKAGKKRLKALGIEAVEEYKKVINGVVTAARYKALVASKHKREKRG